MLNILAVFAHPDDEAMLCGGTLALLAQAGAQVHYICATRGEGGERGDPPVSERAQLGEIRSRELACAVEALGGSSLTFLDYIDPLVGPGESLFAFTDDLETLIDQIRVMLTNTHADVLITHGSNGEYGHPAHVLTHQACLQALKSHQNEQLLLYTVQAIYEGHPKPRLANQDDPADLIIDVEPVKEQKTLAALCHVSQHALFIRITSQDLGRQVTVPEVVMTVESLHKVHWNEHTPETDPFAALLMQTTQVRNTK
jgi:LmbE family N-acetylglucosaminyl deacetylase